MSSIIEKLREKATLVLTHFPKIKYNDFFLSSNFERNSNINIFLEIRFEKFVPNFFFLLDLIII